MEVTQVEDKQYRWHTDPAHGWLEVPQAEIDALGIRDQISAYSFSGINRDNVPVAYLEEDCDAIVFLKAAGLVEAGRDFRDSYSDGESFVRRLRPFCAHER